MARPAWLTKVPEAEPRLLHTITRPSRVFSIVTDPGVDGTVAIVLPLRRNRQWAPGGVVLTEICCVVPSMREAQPLTKAEHARSIIARDNADPMSLPMRPL